MKRDHVIRVWTLALLWAAVLSAVACRAHGSAIGVAPAATPQVASTPGPPCRPDGAVESSSSVLPAIPLNASSPRPDELGLPMGSGFAPWTDFPLVSDVHARFRVRIDASGRVTSACAMDPVDPALGDRIVALMKANWRFAPARLDGQAVPSLYVAKVDLEIGNTLDDVLAHRNSDEGIDRRPIFESRDVTLLKRIASGDRSASRPVWLRYGQSMKSFRTAALERLGELGTPESLDAYDQVWTTAQKVVPTLDRLSGSTLPSPSWHTSDWPVDLRNSANQATSPDGTTYHVLGLNVLGPGRWYVMASRTPNDPASWGRPRATEFAWDPDQRDPKVNWQNGGLALTFAQNGTEQQVTIRPADVWLDSDGDGWTDIEEAILGLDPRNADTDDDGIPDGQDTCPNLRGRPEAAIRDSQRIIQAAIFATFGMTGSRDALFPVEMAEPVPLTGYGGPVIYGRRLPTGDGRARYSGVYVVWRVVNQTADSAMVIVDDWWGPTAAGGLHVYVKKMRGRWYAVAQVPTWIS